MKCGKCGSELQPIMSTGKGFLGYGYHDCSTHELDGKIGYNDDGSVKYEVNGTWYSQEEFERIKKLKAFL